MSWEAHGEWQVVTVGRVVLYEAHGQVNLEAVEEWAQAMARAGRELRKHPWAICGRLDRWQLAVPEAIERVRRLVRDGIAGGCVLQCLCVGGSLIIRDVIETTMPDHEVDGFRWQVVDSIEEVVQALRGHGFDTEADALEQHGFEALLSAGS